MQRKYIGYKKCWNLSVTFTESFIAPYGGYNKETKHNKLVS